MKKAIYIFIGIFLIIGFLGCKTPPVQKSLITINKSIVGTSFESQDEIKIYFPELFVYDNNKQKNVMASGDCIIVKLPDGKILMVDTFDSWIQNQLIQYIKDLGITKIDYLIASHYHSDHIGCMPAIINNFEIGNFYSNGADFDSNICRELHKSLEKKGLQVNVLKEGDSLILSEDPSPCKIDVFWPNLTENDLHNLFYNPGKTAKLKNNSSLVFKLTYKDFSILFTGDIYKSADKILMKKYNSQLKSTVIKVPHHGEFYTANSIRFVMTVSPEIAVIQDTRFVNYFISYIYKNQKSKLLYRETPGHILITSNGTHYKVFEESF